MWVDLSINARPILRSLQNCARLRLESHRGIGCIQLLPSRRTPLIRLIRLRRPWHLWYGWSACISFLAVSALQAVESVQDSKLCLFMGSLSMAHCPPRGSQIEVDWHHNKKWKQAQSPTPQCFGEHGQQHWSVWIILTYQCWSRLIMESTTVVIERKTAVGEKKRNVSQRICIDRRTWVWSGCISPIFSTAWLYLFSIAREWKG